MDGKDISVYIWEEIVKGARQTILWRFSNRSFSPLAFSYSPFSRCRWSGLSLESVGGRFSLIRRKIPESERTMKDDKDS